MKWICEVCNWTGSDEELDSDALGDICPMCGGEVDVDDREPDPLDDLNSAYVSDQMNAIRGQL